VPPNSDVKASTGIEIAENFGQVFNTWSTRNIFSVTNLWQTMSVLKSGQDPDNNNKFMAIDLYDNSGDSADVKDLKTKIKKDIQDCVKNGTSTDKYDFKSMISSLIASDPQYNGKTLGKDDLKYIVNAITSRIISLNTQITNGSGIYDASIGQGTSNFTPLQMVNYISTIANGGTRYKLHLVDKITDSSGNLIEQVQPEVIQETGVSKSTIAAVQYGMTLVTSGDDGTAAATFKGFGIPTAGKTGSATFSNTQEDYGRDAYAIYVGYAPVANPEIAVCIVVFDGGHGSFIAPVARAMYEAYFKTNPAATTTTTTQ
jgi:penicillin-binding protein 2